ncbi:class I SAM-dependent methyltransferase [Acetohalobium arabaticum]|uniref:Methyltransferase type 11 n=1 Tax=Acetohalobium arabaticum (strain ATCC 49924 / DSM 5501 / Z-7288) TaxID=574087 RepID=D9QQ74_ACEAZ|nr:class I SAM-dependent methyltransferase [Acetohalobium arabaticum]ADL12665.1 Methyltransferase type 11 [Acetohalobium arabaticum DSM 5501]
MQLPPKLYNWLVRPEWLTNIYINDLLKENFILKNKDVLDFGCGIGSTSSIFNPEDYLGIDPDQERIKYAQQLYSDYDFQTLDKSKLDFEANSFDYILMIAVLHHIPSDELRDILQQFHQILKSTGKIIVIEPCFFSNSYLNNYFMKIMDNGDYIRNPNQYFKLFQNQYYKVNPIAKYKKMILYNELFFFAIPA